jgi:Dockerin type I domain
VTPLKDDDHLNGISTLDVMMIAEHILNTQPIQSPYQRIAADINKSGAITPFDVTELRKLILGTYKVFPHNTSWRFVDRSFVFADPKNPFAKPLPENISLANVQKDRLEDNFVAIKIGDIDGNAVANSLQKADNRLNGTMYFDIDDRFVKEGQVYEVTVKTAERLLGYQFTLNTDGFDVLDILPGGEMDMSNFAVFRGEGAITTSWNGNRTASFTLKLRPKKAGKLSELLSVSSRITRAEAYDLNRTSRAVALRFNRGALEPYIDAVGFELYQNEPNPFVYKTSVSFNLPEAEEGTFTVYDVVGRTLFTQTAKYAKGINTVVLEGAAIDSDGVMFYQYESDNYRQSKKMIQTRD